MFLFSCMRKEYFKNLIHILCRGRGTDNNWRGGQDGNGKTEQEDAGLESAGRKKLRKLVEESVSNPEELQEIRIRTGQPLLIQMKGQERVLPDPVHPYLVTKEDIGETMGYICHYSLYAYENELKQGFITVEGGHRVGVAGKVIIENEKVKNIQYISSLKCKNFSRSTWVC